MNTQNKIALITGGASGIGKTMALHLAEQGWHVAILDKNQQGLEDTAILSPQISPFYCDVTDFEMVKSVIEQVETTLGPVERFVHCAALMPGGLLHETPPEKLNHLMQVNYGGTVNTTLAMLPYMRARNRGEFIVIGSIAGVVPMMKFGAYGATKAATNHYMKVLMQENKDTAIKFQLACPSTVNTPLVDQVVADGPGFLKADQAKGRNMLSPEEVIQSIEACLKKNQQINYPGAAWMIQFVYRLFPGLVHRIGQRIA